MIRAFLSVVAAVALAAGAALFRKADPHRRAVLARRADRHDLPHHRPENAVDSGTNHLCRESARGRGTIGTRAVVAADPDGYTLLVGNGDACDRSRDQQESRLRFSHCLRADRADRNLLERAGGQSDAASDDGRRPYRLCQGQSGQAQLFLAGDRHTGASDCGAVQGRGRARSGARSLQRRRRLGSGCGVRPGPTDIRESGDRSAPDRGRQRAGAGGDKRDPQPAPSRGSDHGGERHRRFCSGGAFARSSIRARSVLHRSLRSGAANCPAMVFE
jgi:hypothetical protein